MTISQLHKSAIDKALKYSLSFALFRDKNSAELCFICDDGSSKEPLSDIIFYAVNWLDKFDDRIEIFDRLSIDDVINYKSTARHELFSKPWGKSTDKSDYICKVSNLIKLLKVNNGKTVISRAIVTPISRPIADITEEYFNVNSNTYCCLLHTPQTGCWLIASPEILLVADYKCNQLQTVALAGTRPINSVEPWDDKNISEQKIVEDFITKKLSGLGFTYNVSEITAAKTNNIEHLATYITASFKHSEEIQTIINSLSPTPALCGTPRDESINHIQSIENHPRRLYGGYFGYYNNNIFKAIVTLRCAQLSLSSACIYAGGGITPASEATQEWEETTLKSEVIANILTKFNHEER